MPRLVVTAGPDAGTTFELTDTAVLGRDRDATFPLADQGTSRKHVRIWRSPEGWSAIDLGSKNGTYVNGEPVTRAALKEGDVIMIGATRMRIEGVVDMPQAAAPRAATATGDGVEVRTAAGKIGDKALTSKKPRSDGALDVDLSQYPWWIRAAIVLGVLAVVGGIAWLAWKAGGGTMPV